MQIGLHALGIGPGARPDVIRAVSVEAERHGFARLWAGEHVVMVDDSRSRYPYAPDGRIAVPAEADWLDPMPTLAYAAAVTSRIGLATGILLLPEHNPVAMAKTAATLDVLCDGRLTLGVGVGWSAEEFAALGVPFRGRVRRTAEYVEVMRLLWRHDVADFAGEFAAFDAIRVYPKPVHRRIPVIVGGNSDAALDRVAAWGDGWYGFNLDSVPAVAERLDRLDAACRSADRDRSTLHCAVALRDPDPADLSSLTEMGVDELVLVASPPADADRVGEWLADVADDWRPGRFSPQP